MENECVGCYNIMHNNYPTNGYSQSNQAFIMLVAEGWLDPNNNNKPIRLAYIKFCPVCGKKLVKEVKQT